MPVPDKNDVRRQETNPSIDSPIEIFSGVFADEFVNSVPQRLADRAFPKPWAWVILRKYCIEALRYYP
jgi:hypothetical protein